MLRGQIRELTAVRVRYGYVRIYILLGAKAGRSITSACTGCIVRRGSACGSDGRGVM
jgi:hypothetical protein